MLHLLAVQKSGPVNRSSFVSEIVSLMRGREVCTLPFAKRVELIMA